MTGTAAADRRAILIAHSYYLRYDEKQLRRIKPYPPLATVLAAAVVRCRGHDVRFFCAMLSAGVAEVDATLDVARPALVGLLEGDLNFLAKVLPLRMRCAVPDSSQVATA